MKTILMVFALALALTLAGSASNVSFNTKSQTENMVASSTKSSSTIKSGKSKKAHSKKAHHKHHKGASGSKKTK
jgi:hypothetical protein